MKLSDSIIEAWKETRERVRTNLTTIEANRRVASYYDSKDLEFIELGIIFYAPIKYISNVVKDIRK